jgi:hypothetical protein
MAAYVNQFLELTLDPYDLVMHGLVTNGPRLFRIVRQLLRGHSLEHMHATALAAENAITKKSNELARAHKEDAQTKDPVKLATEYRATMGDVDIFRLSITGVAAPSPLRGVPEKFGFPHYFAIIALWKAIDLKHACDSFGAPFSVEWNAASWRPIGWPHEIREGAPKSVKVVPLETAARAAVLAQLSSEVTRACLLADYEEELPTAALHARAIGRFEALREVQHQVRDRLRDAGSLGGQRRAERYAPIKERAVKLYKDGAYRSRNAAASDIFQTLVNEGIETTHSFVLKALTEHDRRIVSARSVGREDAGMRPDGTPLK